MIKIECLQPYKISHQEWLIILNVLNEHSSGWSKHKFSPLDASDTQFMLHLVIMSVSVSE